MTPKQITLQAALQHQGLRELPKELSSSDAVWITAIALVTKSTGNQEYVLIQNDGDSPSVKRDYGTLASIVQYDRIYPVEKLERRFMPDLRSDSQMTSFLVKNGANEAQISRLLSKEDKSTEEIRKDRETVKKMIVKSAIKLAKQTLKEEARCRSIGKVNKDGKNQEEEPSGED